MVGNMTKIGWNFLAAVNIKGGTDSLFFTKQSFQPLQTAMVSLNRQDRIRLIDFNDPNLAMTVQKTIQDNWQSRGNEVSVRDYYGAHEFKLDGYPFHCSGHTAMSARRLICRIFVSRFRVKKNFI